MGVPQGCSIQWTSDRSLRIDSPAPAHAIVRALRVRPPPGVLDIVPADGSLLLTVDPSACDADAILRAVTLAVERVDKAEAKPRTHVIEVCYDPSMSPDLFEVSQRAGMSVEEVVRAHTSTEFTVGFLGFAPGFGYLMGLPQRLRVPRLDSPRERLPAGSVGLAGPYTGIYALPGPGGWRIIGRTNKVMFDATRDEPALLRAGDVVRFRAIPESEFSR